MTLDQLIRESQVAVCAYADGKPGIETWTKIHSKLCGNPVVAPPVITGGIVDARSEKNIQMLHPKVQPYARALVTRCAERLIKIIVTSATRTYAEQDALYEQGRTAPGDIVTNAHAGFSNHNFGTAFDITIFEGVNPLWESPLYKAVGAIGIELGLEWGGNWHALVDEPHFELHPVWSKDMTEGQMLSELRRRHESGTDAFA